MFYTPADRSYNVGPQESKEDRTRLFEQAFAGDGKPLPKPSFSSWRVNNNKASRLSFSELILLNDFVEAGVPYADLPAWIRDSGVLEVEKDEKKKQEQLTKETGLDLSERQTVFNAFKAQTEALAELSENPIVKDTDVLMMQFDNTAGRFGLDQLMDELQQKFPNAAEYFSKKLTVRQAEAEAKKAQQQQQAATRKDLETAKQRLLLDAIERNAEVE